MLQDLRKGLQSILGREEGGEHEAPSTLESSEGHLTIRQGPDGVELLSSFLDKPLLVIAGRLEGLLNTVQGQVAGRRALFLTFSLRSPAGGGKVQVTVASHGSLDGSLPLARSSRRFVPPASQAVEFVLGGKEREIRYLVEMDQAFCLVGFHEFCESRVVFDEIPPVAQMTAFLKATLQRKPIIRELRLWLRNRPDPAIEDIVDALDRPGLKLEHPTLTALQTAARDLLSPWSDASLAALVLLSEILSGKLTLADLDQMADTFRLEVSDETVGVVSIAAGLEPMPDPPNALAAQLLEWTGRRRALTLLQELAESSGSERSRDRVRRLLHHVGPDQVLVNDEHLALQACLLASGCTLDVEMIAALGIYVDFEAGILSEADIQSLRPSRGFLDTSLYGMVAICGAYDVDVRALCLKNPSRASAWRDLRALMQMTGEGLVARFLEPGQSGWLTLWLPDLDAAEAAQRRGLLFTGEVLAGLPVLEHLHPQDLDAMLQAEPRLTARFGSEDDHNEWRRADTALSEDAPGYIDGWRRYHFLQQVVGRLVDFDPRKHKRLKSFVAVYHDQRGNAHYRYCESWTERVEQPISHGVNFAGKWIRFPRAGRGEAVWKEPSRAYLLGRPEERTLSQRRLDRIYAGLESHFLGRAAWHELDGTRLAQLLRRSRLTAMLHGVVDATTLHTLARNARDKTIELSASEPLVAALDLAETQGYAAMAIFSAMAGHLQRLEPERLRQAILESFFALGESSQPVLRWLACRLLGSEVTPLGTQEELAVRYVLLRLLEESRPSAGEGAAQALAALALQNLKPTVRVRQASLRRDDASDLRQVRNDLDAWLAGGAPPHLALRLQDEQRVEALVRWVMLANKAFRQDGSVAEPRFLLLLTETEAHRLVVSSLTAWRAFLEGTDSAPEEAAELREAFRQFVTRGWVMARPPWLAGATLFALRPHQELMPRGALFEILAETFEADVDGSSLQLLRWMGEGGGVGEMFEADFPILAHELWQVRPWKHDIIPFFARDTLLRRNPSTERALRRLAALTVPRPVAPVAGPAPVIPSVLEDPEANIRALATVFDVAPDHHHYLATMLSGLRERIERFSRS